MSTPIRVHCSFRASVLWLFAAAVVILGMNTRTTLRADQGRGARAGAQAAVATPCVGNAQSAGCFQFRLGRLDDEVDALQKSVEQLDARVARVEAGVQKVQSGHVKADGSTDDLWTSVKQLTERIAKLEKR